MNVQYLYSNTEVSKNEKNSAQASALSWRVNI